MSFPLEVVADSGLFHAEAVNLAPGRFFNAVQVEFVGWAASFGVGVRFLHPRWKLFFNKTVLASAAVVMRGAITDKLLLPFEFCCHARAP